MCKLLIVLLLSQALTYSSYSDTGSLLGYYEPEENEDIIAEVPQDDSDEEMLPEASYEPVLDKRRNLYLSDDYDEKPIDPEDSYYQPPANPTENTHAEPTRRQRARAVQRSTQRPLECYSCSFRKGQSLKACLDPMKYKAPTITCHSPFDVCYTSVEGDSPEDVRMAVRGCRSACQPSPQWSCCERDKCNSVPLQATKPHGELVRRSGSPPSPAPHQHAAFFVGVLLLLQTVLRIVLL